MVFSFWSGRRGSNSLPRPWQGRALPDELRPQTAPLLRHLGASGRSRTNDTRIFSPLLYQLSYRGISSRCCSLIMATTKGLEPSTSGVTGRRSNQLNYMAVYARCRVTSTQQINYSTYNACCKEFFLAGAERFELSTRGFGDRCSTS